MYKCVLHLCVGTKNTLYSLQGALDPKVRLSSNNIKWSYSEHTNAPSPIQHLWICVLLVI